MKWDVCYHDNVWEKIELEILFHTVNISLRLDYFLHISVIEWRTISFIK